MGFFFKKDKDKDLQRNYRRYYMRGKLDRRTFISCFLQVLLELLIAV